MSATNGAPISHERRSRFHYCDAMEHALSNLFGLARSDGVAGLCEDACHVRRQLLKAVRRIREHLDGIITSDDRLRITTASTIDALEQEVKRLREGDDNSLEIIAQLMLLVSELIGFDWDTGKVNRHIIYYQTRDQQQLDDEKTHPRDYCFMLEGDSIGTGRRKVAMVLKDEGFHVAKIAAIMKLPESRVKGLLREATNVRAGKR